MPTIQLPSHAYLPGQNKRHREDAFDAIRRTAVKGYTVEQLSNSEAFQAGLKFLDAGFYWEAHEVLEPVWMLLPDNSEERQFVQGLIQLANGCLKLRMGKPKAAQRLVGLARDLISSKQTLNIMTLEVAEVHGWIDALERDALLVL